MFSFHKSPVSVFIIVHIHFLYISFYDHRLTDRSAPHNMDESNADNRLPKQARVDCAPSDDDSLSSCPTWPLDRMCTNLLGDLWALRWETRHGAASGLRELLSEPRHTWQAGKCAGMSEQEVSSLLLECN